MIACSSEKKQEFAVEFIGEHDCVYSQRGHNFQKIFKGEYLQHITHENENGQMCLYVGLGSETLTKNQILEVTAYAATLMKEYKVQAYDFEVGRFIAMAGLPVLEQIAHGICLGNFEKYKNYKECVKQVQVNLIGITPEDKKEAETFVFRGETIGEGVLFARELVNSPSNLLKPMDMAKRIMDELEALHNENLEMELFVYGQLRTMGMQALCSVGESSVNPPCFLVLRYNGQEKNSEKIGLVGKGVTVDTGGYCLKPASSMAGIKGDMAGAAAVASTVYGLAKNNCKTNVVALLPMCENRISKGSLLPGDVISSYSGKTIEVMNTDAEGRLILADAVSYAVKNEDVTNVLDIATLTGAVVNMLGFSIAGVLSDSDLFYDRLVRAAQKSGEKYHRLPYGEEHEKMIESEVADVKNLGESYCGTITAGLFIKRFAEGVKWMHIDIAGTAWVDNPIWKYQKTGATGAAVSTLYYLCEEE